MVQLLLLKLMWLVVSERRIHQSFPEVHMSLHKGRMIESRKCPFCDNYWCGNNTEIVFRLWFARLVILKSI